jgi:hypothetical protein
MRGADFSALQLYAEEESGENGSSVTVYQQGRPSESAVVRE